ncbi:VOC family protein [Nocardioides sp. HM23]|uniref:VOC family protein n=1 Tax=Nocardioides bizhenqiangii TaxID=3095076 RepID=UPI002ACA6C2C|nr:VOC family protein [Nocardioides sp. HM23]MDZ5619678.1 VOC family protein [Nocardioides sp. HM23]
MKTLFPAFRVSDLDVALGFYTALGYDVVGNIDVGGGTRLAMLALPEEPDVSLELVHRPADGRVDPGGFDHLAVQADDLDATRERLLARGLRPSDVELPGGLDGPRTAWLVDPDGYRIELVQWPPGHPVGMTRADFTDQPS